MCRFEIFASISYTDILNIPDLIGAVQEILEEEMLTDHATLECSSAMVAVDISDLTVQA